MGRIQFQIKPILRKHWPLAAMTLACAMMLTAVLLLSSGAVAMDADARPALRGDRTMTALSARLDGRDSEGDAKMVETIAASSFGGGFIRDDRVNVYVQAAISE